MSYCKKCYVDSKKAGIIEENGQYFLGSFVTAWNDGSAPVGNRFGFLKFSRLNAGNYTDSVVEIENRFGHVAEEGTPEFAEIREAAAAKKAASATAAPAQGAPGATSSQGATSFADPMSALAGLFGGIEQNVTNKVMEQVNAAIAEILANQVPQRVEHVITLPDGSENKMKNKIIAVIRSCKNEEQLENARKWANDVMYLNKITKEYIYKIDKAHKAKMQQIHNGLAAKYN